MYDQMRRSRRTAGALLALVLTACSMAFVAAAVTPTEAKAAYVVEPAGPDSLRLIGKWTPKVDAKGAPDSYRVEWSGLTVLRAVVRVVANDTFMMQRPAVNDSAFVKLGVVAIRRGILAKDTARASMWVRNPDAPPPSVDSIKIDTLPSHVDSMRMSWRSSSGGPLSSPLLAEGDSAFVSVRFFIANGYSRMPRDTVKAFEMHSVTPGSVARVSRRWSDSAWIVAQSCGCAESGDASNRPMLDLRSGEYVVRDGSRLRPVVALAPDPYQRE